MDLWQKLKRWWDEQHCSRCKRWVHWRLFNSPLCVGCCFEELLHIHDLVTREGDD
jgi:hypothetical protein